MDPQACKYCQTHKQTSVTGQSIIRSLRDHPDNLLPSQVTPRTINGQKMTPTGKLPVQIKIRNRTHKDELHIYPNVKGALMSWGTYMALSILPPSYPQPIEVQTITSETTQQVTSQNLINEFPSVFNNKVKPMKGEQFHITLIDDAKPFCVKTPRTKSRAPELGRARHNHTRIIPHRVVRSHRSSTQERN